MDSAMILQAFAGDHFYGWRNRQPNELLFTAHGNNGDTFSAIVPAAMIVQTLAPLSRTLPVTDVTKDGEVFHGRLARFDDEPPVHSGIYLASMRVVVFVAGTGFFTGTALASIAVDEDLPAIPRPSSVDARTAARAVQETGD